ncbi:MAG: UDP-N-acetylmuramate dehydrogenase [Clostridia bacterium]|nr:UDP-N-acetylmuramate dehydrogenase [Clostridia bacterium]
MQLDLFKAALKEIGVNFCENEPMKKHTSFKIGGDADLFLYIKNADELKEVLALSKEYKVETFILGNGSNLLVSDKGIRGAVLCLCGMDGIEVSGEEIICQAGAKLSSVCIAAKQNGLSGLEFAYGIPGTVGGGLFMNAGAYGSEMANVVTKADYITLAGDIKTIELKDMELGYRTSVFKKGGKIITKVYFSLKSGKTEEIERKMNEFICRRKEKQPLEYPSAGSTFKRPEGNFAGTLIEQSGLKGEKIGGAMVSEKHAGFVINFNDATCEDVKSLIKHIQQTVKEKNGVNLETEVITVGED